jgi:phage gpG-like protein
LEEVAKKPGVDTEKAVKALLKAAGRKELGLLAAAAFKKPFTDGVRKVLLGSGFEENSPAWKKKKGKKGWGGRPWVRTGKTLKAVGNNPPRKLGTKKGLKVGVNWKSNVAFAHPRTFTDSSGRKRLSAKDQEKVLMVLQRGSGAERVRKQAAKKGRSFDDVWSETTGVKKKDFFVPARPLLSWVKSWEPEIEKDVERAVKAILAGEGFEV